MSGNGVNGAHGANGARAVKRPREAEDSLQVSAKTKMPAISNVIVNSRTAYKYLENPLTVEIVGCSFSGGQPRGGVEHGPTKMMEHGLAEECKSLDWKVIINKQFATYDHLKPTTEEEKHKKHNNLKNATYVSKVTESVYHSVKTICEKRHLALTLGGDHSIAIGTVSGSAAAYENLGVVWVDAHADINTPETTSSGNLHGCPVSFLIGLAGKVPGFEWHEPCLPKNRIVYIGLRDLDPPEKKLLRDHGIRAFSMSEVDRWGIGRVMEMALEYIGDNCPIHLSFDVDALDPTVAPATGTPVRGGLTFREGHYICEAMHQTGQLVAVDIMEVNPMLGDEAARAQTVQGKELTRNLDWMFAS
ncbi:Arginase, catabolizes arginine to ornithine and urea [Irineochytrium annulatum]|nr:Arginase, catabolizes arginine to ornithine and urea [Irineochytrium annulatum]